MSREERTDEQELARRLARESLPAYIRLHHKDYKRGAHIDRMCAALHRVEQGLEDRVIILCPPRHSKSFHTTENFPAWYLGRHPDHYVISASYGQDLADKFGAKVRNKVASPIHQWVFDDPRCEISSDSQAKNFFTLRGGGQYMAAGRGSAITGVGAHLFIVDDPIKDKVEAQSELIREQLHEWFATVAYTRLQPGGKIVVIQTLWHEDDLAGWLMREHASDGWKVYKFQAIAERDEDFRKAGEALWPEFMPLEELERRRSVMRSDEWLALYQQSATAESGNFFRVAWLENCWLPRPDDGQGLNKYILVDPATSKKRGSDYTAMWVIGLGADQNVRVLDIVRDKLSLSERADKLFDLHQKWHQAGAPVLGVGYEEYALSGDIPYIQERQQRIKYDFAITPLGGHIRKEERIKELEPWFRQGRIKLPRQFWYTPIDGGSAVDLTRLFLEEYRSFPNAAHDDMLDALARFTDANFPLDWPMTAAQMSHQAALARRIQGRGSWMAA